MRSVFFRELQERLYTAMSFGWASVSTPTPVAGMETGDHLKSRHKAAP